jgi:hypothetical protein
MGGEIIEFDPTPGGNFRSRIFSDCFAAVVCEQEKKRKNFRFSFPATPEWPISNAMMRLCGVDAGHF